LPGFARAQAISSVTDFAGTRDSINSIDVKLISDDTGAKSFTMV
jgi:hypothetical protein